MRKAEVILKEGFRYYRVDNHFYDVRLGDEVDLDDMTPRDSEARLQAGHVVILNAKNATDAKVISDKSAADAKKLRDEKAVDERAAQVSADRAIAISAMTPEDAKAALAADAAAARAATARADAARAATVKAATMPGNARAAAAAQAAADKAEADRIAALKAAKP